MALTQNPDGENWSLLVQSLPVVDGAFAQQVLVALARKSIECPISRSHIDR